MRKIYVTWNLIGSAKMLNQSNFIEKFVLCMLQAVEAAVSLPVRKIFSFFSQNVDPRARSIYKMSNRIDFLTNQFYWVGSRM